MYGKQSPAAKQKKHNSPSSRSYLDRSDPAANGTNNRSLTKLKQANELRSSTELAESIKNLENAIENPNTIELLIVRATNYNVSVNLKKPSRFTMPHCNLMLITRQPCMASDWHYVLGKIWMARFPLLQQTIILAPDRPDYYNDLGILFLTMPELSEKTTIDLDNNPIH